MCLEQILEYKKVCGLPVIKMFEHRDGDLFLPFRGDRKHPLPIKKWVDEFEFRGMRTDYLIYSKVGLSYRTGFHCYDSREDLMDGFLWRFVTRSDRRFMVARVCYINGDSTLGIESGTRVWVSGMLYITDEEADYVRRP